MKRKPRKLKKVHVKNGPIPRWLMRKLGQFSTMPDYLFQRDGRTMTSLTLRPHIGLTVDLGADALTAAAAPSEGETEWTSPAFMFTDTWTNEGRRDGGRMIDPDGFHIYGTADTLPLMAQVMTPAYGGHEGAVLAGLMHRDTIIEGSGPIPAAGVFAATEYGAEIAAMYAAGYMTGVSADLAIMGYEIVYITDEETGEIMDADFIARDWAVMGATGTPFPAFENARIDIGEAAKPEPVVEDEAAREAITAAAQHHPPADWFAMPEPDVLTPFTVEGDRVFGHLAPWKDEDGEACHVGYSDVCVCAPASPSGYARFMVGEIECDDGTTVAVGSLTLRGGHAPLSATPADAAAHYDDTDSASAYVTIIDGELGPWLSGCVRPGLTDDDRFALRAATLSGDWRELPPRSGTLDLLRVCCVNTGGFSVPRTQAVVAGGRVVAMEASGVGVMGRLKADVLAAERPVTMADVSEIRTLVDTMTESLREALAVTSAMEPEARQKLLDRIG